MSAERGILLHDPVYSTVEIIFHLAGGEAEQLLINSRSEFFVPFSGTAADLDNEAVRFLELVRQSDLL